VLIKKPFKKGMRPSIAPYYATVGVVGPPSFTWRAQPITSSAGQTEVLPSFSIGAGSVQQALFISLVNAQVAGTATVSSITVVTSPSTNSQNFTIDTNNGLHLTTLVAHCLITAATDTSAVVTINWSSNPFVKSNVSAWTAPASGFNSLTPTGASSVHSASATVFNTTLATTASGFVLLGTGNNVTAAQSVAFSGTESYSVPVGYTNGVVGSIFQAVADTHGTTIGTNASNSVTATYGVAGAGSLSVAAWR